jgi:hypothetical protein
MAIGDKINRPSTQLADQAQIDKINTFHVLIYCKIAKYKLIMHKYCISTK